jgi:DNA-binding transcriptional ArsR family regulator
MEQKDIEYLTELDRVTVLLHPLRLQIMELAIEETSGTDAARRLGLPRQMVSYHVSALEKAGFLVPIGEVRRRNMVERRMRTSARAYIISPDILGPVSGARRRPPDPGSPAALLALTARVQRDLGNSLHSAAASAVPPALSFSSKLHFSAASSRSAFIKALGDSVGQVIRDHSASRVAGDPHAQSYSLVLGLYPLPHPTPPAPEGEQQ